MRGTPLLVVKVTSLCVLSEWRSGEVSPEKGKASCPGRAQTCVPHTLQFPGKDAAHKFPSIYSLSESALRPGFVNNVEWGFCSTPKTAESRRLDYIANARFPGLRAKAEPHFL